jgi:hypothetical protein
MGLSWILGILKKAAKSTRLTTRRLRVKAGAVMLIKKGNL